MMKQTLALSLLAAVATTQVSAHGFLSVPKPRQYRSDTNSWKTYNVHNGGGLLTYGNTSPPNNDVANLNGLLGGAPSNGETTGFNEGDSGLCGDKGDRKWFMAPNQFGPTEPRATWMAGGTARVEVAITAYHGGHFEFRLAVPEDGGADTTVPITQIMLNRHILEIAPSTPFYSDVTNYQGMKGYGGYSGHGGEFKCKTTGGHVDATATSPQVRWPHGSCCNGGGGCSAPEQNTDRYVLEFGVNGAELPASRNEFQTTYAIDLKIPTGIKCERCVLQWTYQTANSADGWPETFRNCADIAVQTDGVVTEAPPADVTPTPAPAPAPASASSSVASPIPAPPIPPPPIVTAPVSTTTGKRCVGKTTTAFDVWCAATYVADSTCTTYPDHCKLVGNDEAANTEEAPNPAPHDEAPAPTSVPHEGTPAPTSAPPAAACAATIVEWGNCHTASGCCAEGLKCVKQSRWYSQCNKDDSAPGAANGAPSSPTPEAAVSSPSPSPSSSSTPTPAAPATPAPTTPAPPAPTGTCTPDGSTGFEKTVSAAQVLQFFLDWGLNYNGKTGLDAAVEIRSHIVCAIAMKPAAFGSFCNAADADTNMREAAAFFSNVRKETGGFNKMEETAPHRYCTSDSLSGAGTELQAASNAYPCSTDSHMSYHGRGAIQLSWNINYGRFSEFLYGDRSVLLSNPNLVVPAGATGWASTLWFWMSDQGFGGTAPPVQLDACVPTGTMSPHAAIVGAGAASGHAGMAQTINIINGGWECAVTSPHRVKATQRMQSYLDFAGMLGVAPHPECSSIADCAAKGVNLGAGCALIVAAESNACPLECTQKDVADWTGAKRFSCESKCTAAQSSSVKTALSRPCSAIRMLRGRMV